MDKKKLLSGLTIAGFLATSYATMTSSIASADENPTPQKQEMKTKKKMKKGACAGGSCGAMKDKKQTKEGSCSGTKDKKEMKEGSCSGMKDKGQAEEKKPE